MKNGIFSLFLITCFQGLLLSQGVGISFKKAEEQGISYDSLNKVYNNAVNVDTSDAVFKTEEEQKAMYYAYAKMITDFGTFLKENGFALEKDTRCFNRIYFSPDGKIEYFLFNFFEKDNNKPTEEAEDEFQRILSLFIQKYQFPLKAAVRFAQCGTVVYKAKEK